jgi:16S rRNA (cytidine1402-2'-O)-methyltransferase
MQGTLYIVATPIGHLEDITLRALRVLREVDLIACEDTRQTRKLLARHEIKTPTISYHEHNEQQRSRELINKLKDGTSIALVSDAGTPTVSDPGLILIQRAIAEGIPVVPLPGPSAVITALMAAGLPTEAWLFIGFLPAKRAARRKELEKLKGLPYTLIFYEAPHRIQTTVKDLLEILGDRQAVLAREMTKVHEEFQRASLSKFQQWLEERPIKGELVLMVAGASQLEMIVEQPAQAFDVYEEALKLMRSENLDLKVAVKTVAKRRGMSKNEVYREYVSRRRAEEGDE